MFFFSFFFQQYSIPKSERDRGRTTRILSLHTRATRDNVHQPSLDNPPVRFSKFENKIWQILIFTMKNLMRDLVRQKHQTRFTDATLLVGKKASGLFECSYVSVLMIIIFESPCPHFAVSVAFDLATHRGYDSDHPRVVGSQ